MHLDPYAHLLWYGLNVFVFCQHHHFSDHRLLRKFFFNPFCIVMLSFVRLRRCSQVPRNYFIYYVCLSSCNHIMEADSYLHSTPMKWNQGSSYSLTYSQFASFILLDLMSFPLGYSHKRVFIDYFELASWIRTNNNKTRLEISWHQNQNSFCNTIYLFNSWFVFLSYFDNDVMGVDQRSL